MLGPKKVITASQHRIANALGPNQSTFRQCDWNPLDSNDNWTLFFNKNVFVRLGFRIYIFCCVYVFPYLFHHSWYRSANETRACTASMMDYQTQRRFGKRAKVHVKDDRHVSVHFKNKKKGNFKISSNFPLY